MHVCYFRQSARILSAFPASRLHQAPDSLRDVVETQTQKQFLEVRIIVICFFSRRLKKVPSMQHIAPSYSNIHIIPKAAKESSPGPQIPATDSEEIL